MSIWRSRGSHAEHTEHTDRDTLQETDRPADRDIDRDADRDEGRPTIFRQREGDHDADVLRRAAHDRAHDRFGGVNPGAAFFGWLSAMGLTAILAGIVAAAASALGYQNQFSEAQAEQAAGTVGIVSGLVLLCVLVLAYFAGGYVAGRMSRFDGAKQGVAVWAIGLLVTILAAVAGWLAGDAYNVLNRVEVPSIPIPTDQLTWGGIIAGLLILLGTLVAAMVGGKVGQRYHDKVDTEAYDWR